MYLIGLTGGVASGKSTVSAMFRDLGVPVIDADVLAKRILLPGTNAHSKVRKEFPEAFDPLSGELDRKKLRNKIFGCEKERKKLDGITHPEICKEMIKESAKCLFRGYSFVILDLPLLLEAGVMVEYMHKIIVVSCEPDLQLQRLMEQRKLSEKDSKLMMEAQMPLSQKEAKADFVIENSGSLYDTECQVKDIFDNYLIRSNFHWKIRFYLGLTLGSFFGISFYIGKKVLNWAMAPKMIKSPALELVTSANPQRNIFVNQNFKRLN